MRPVECCPFDCGPTVTCNSDETGSILTRLHSGTIATPHETDAMPIFQKYEGTRVVELPPSPCASDSVEAVFQALRQAGRASARVVVDLCRVRHVEGELLGLLVRSWKQLGARPGDIVLIVDELQREVFTATRLDYLFVLVASRSEAVATPWPDPVPTVVTGLRRAA
jgi:hypothetical protein